MSHAIPLVITPPPLRDDDYVDREYRPVEGDSDQKHSTGCRKSTCCNAPITTVNGYEGTSFYRCTECGYACDPQPQTHNIAESIEARPHLTDEESIKEIERVVKIVKANERRKAEVPKWEFEKQLLAVIRDFEHDMIFRHDARELVDHITFASFMEWLMEREGNE